MVFCGGCGKQANSKDTFCTGCGTKIIEPTISVLEDTGNIIKEEYKQSTIPPEAETSQGTHIGDQKKSGEWLESTTAHILKFAGFDVDREVSFVFNDRTNDKFRIDVLARDPDTEIFVECKDYSDLKMSEKIMYTLTGQLDDYRKDQNKDVVGILVMSAKDDGRNQGIRENLKKHNCFLWDGAFLEHLENKIIELENKKDFRRYVLDHLDIFEELEKKNDGEYYDFMIKYSAYTMPLSEYVGKSFEIMNIIDEINDKLPQNVNIINHTRQAIKFKESKEIWRYNLIFDFSFKLTMNQIEKYAKSKRKFSDRIRRTKPEQITYRSFREGIYDILSNTYGISYDTKEKDEFHNIDFIGSRVK